MINSAADKIISRIPEMSDADRARLRSNCEKNAASGSKAGEAGAIIEALDAFEKEALESRRSFLDGLSDAGRIYEAFRTKPISDHEAKLIQALLDRPGATADELNKAVAYEGGWYMQFGIMAHKRLGHVIEAPHSKTRRDDRGRPEPFWSGILADFDYSKSTYTMKPAAIEAFKKLGLRSATN